MLTFRNNFAYCLFCYTFYLVLHFCSGPFRVFLNVYCLQLCTVASFRKNLPILYFYMHFDPYYNSSEVLYVNEHWYFALFVSVNLFQSFTLVISLIPKRGFHYLFYNMSLNVNLNKQQKNSYWVLLCFICSSS